MNNEILEEIWKTRKKIEKLHDGDLGKVFASMQRKTAESPRPVYKGSLRRKKSGAKS